MATTEDYEVTLASLRETVDRALALPASENAHARGYQRAMSDVKAILDMHGRPASEPVHFGATP